MSFMSRTVLVVLLGLASCPHARAVHLDLADAREHARGEAADKESAQVLEVRVDARVELMSVIFRLAGSPEYGQARVPAYAEAVDAWFAPHRDHAVVEIARELRRKRGVSYDAVMSMAIHVRDVESLDELVPFDAPGCSLEKRWRPDEARQFLAAARDFVVAAELDRFLEQHAALHELTASRMRALLERSADLAWFDRYFGAEAEADFTVVLGMLNGPANYGPKVVFPDGRESLHAILGVHRLDGDGAPLFDESDLPTFVHEFSHSYVNHLVDRHAEDLRAAGEAMFVPVERSMRRQAYGGWQTMLCESLVRAAVVRYVAEHDGPEAGRRQVAHEAGLCGFVWMEALAESMERYERSRERYASFAQYMPEIVRLFDELAPSVPALAARHGHGPPQGVPPTVVEFTPALGSTDVDPALDRIVVRFDRPMSAGYSVMLGPEGRASFPAVTASGFDASQTVFTMQVVLEPDRAYAFSLNGPDGGGFRSAEDGTPLAMVKVRFRTRP